MINDIISLPLLKEREQDNLLNSVHNECMLVHRQLQDFELIPMRRLGKVQYKQHTQNIYLRLRGIHDLASSPLTP